MVRAFFQNTAMRLLASRFCAVAVLQIVCVGCWEEIRYDPSKHQTPTAHRDQTNVPVQTEQNRASSDSITQEASTSDAPSAESPATSAADVPHDPSRQALEWDDSPSVDPQPAPAAELDFPIREP